MFCVGLTGQIGSGKSTVGEVFIGLGVPLYDCDSRAKCLMLTDLREQIIAHFGTRSYLPDGRLDRRYLAAEVFSNSEQRQRLEGIVHPAVESDLRGWIEQNRKAPYVVVESAILIGNVIEQLIDYLVVVVADRQEIICRVMRRDGVSQEQVEQRLAAQMDLQQMISRAKSVIRTSLCEPIIPKVVALHEKLLTLPHERFKN